MGVFHEGLIENERVVANVNEANGDKETYYTKKDRKPFLEFQRHRVRQVPGPKFREPSFSQTQ